MKLPKVTLDQWATFKAVVDEGSFAKAAEVLSKSQSSISYAIAKLEEQLPAPVLSLNGRKAVMTEEGKVLYRRASQLLNHAYEVEQTANCLAQGWEAEVIIGLDSIIDMEPLFNSIDRFTEQAPHTRIVLLESTLSGTAELLLEKKANIVLSGQTPPGFLGQPIDSVNMVPVAQTNHPLCRGKRDLTDQDLKQHRQIVVRDSGVKRNQDTGWLGSEQRLTVTHFSHSIQALIRGLGFAFIPSHLAEPFIKTGQLKTLNLSTRAERRIQIYLTLASPDAAGPATQVMRDILIDLYNRR
ncbi:MAG: LysR family transcriptional regulator [Gammaproteobacteria bacterium]|nr:LysR family transcriptional regulator [Gammaproteobacteria bacterium]